MGAKLKKYFDLVRTKGGLPARMRLSLKINIPSSEALKRPDSPEDIEKLRKVAKEILGEDLPIL